MVDVAVIGVGSMGKHHARIYYGMEGVRLVGVCDLDIKRALAVGGPYQCPAFVDYEEMIQKVKPKAVSIAVPADSHYDVARDVLLYCDVLMEKPLAPNEALASSLMRLAEKGNRVLMPGHVLRFKPSVGKLKAMLPQLGLIYHIEFVRRTPYSGRGGDVSVLMDMGIHDVDMLFYLFPGLPYKNPVIGGAGQVGIKTTTIDWFKGQMYYKMPDMSELIVSFDISRCEMNKRGTQQYMNIYGAEGVLTVEREETGVRKDNRHRYYPDVEYDALEMELTEFIGQVNCDTDSCQVTAMDGVLAVEMVMKLERAAMANWSQGTPFRGT